MAAIKINTGLIRLKVECDGREEEIVFNPDDVVFMDKFVNLMDEMEKKQAEYDEKAKELDAETNADSFGVPLNMKEKLALMLDICTFMRGQVDMVFGVGTSQKIFGNANTLDMFTQFFDGITPYIQKNREEKMAKYIHANTQGVM